jgi:RNA polymerase sigma-70 factor (ECF subfamily)
LFHYLKKLGSVSINYVKTSLPDVTNVVVDVSLVCMEQQKELEKVIVGMRQRLMDEARRYLRNQNEAEDMVQDVVLKLWTMRDNLGDCHSVEAMAVVITRHLCLNRNREHDKKLDIQALREMTDSMSPEQQLIGQETVGRLLEQIDALPDRQQIILRMKHLDGMEVGEIAAMTGMTIASVRQNLSRARKNIMKRFLR